MKKITSSYFTSSLLSYLVLIKKLDLNKLNNLGYFSLFIKCSYFYSKYLWVWLQDSNPQLLADGVNGKIATDKICS